jgi:toxin ParE1/3/4
MSVHKLPIALTRAAQEDLREIAAYTLQQWGEERWATYRDTFQRALLMIGDNPQIGRARDDLRVGYRAYLLEQHYIFYRVTRRRIVVSRIIHSRRDLRRAVR